MYTARTALVPYSYRMYPYKPHGSCYEFVLRALVFVRLVGPHYCLISFRTSSATHLAEFLKQPNIAALGSTLTLKDG